MGSCDGSGPKHRSPMDHVQTTRCPWSSCKWFWQNLWKLVVLAFGLFPFIHICINLVICRLIPAMDSTVKASNQITIINQKCGQKIGLVGESHHQYYNLPPFVSFAFLSSDIWFLTFFRYTEYGGAVPYRPPEDTAFSVARFIANSGSFVNYYMVSV